MSKKPGQQSSLDSFFGVQNKAKQQKNVTSFFKKQSDKENDDNVAGNDDVDATAKQHDQQSEKGSRSKSSNVIKNHSNKKRESPNASNDTRDTEAYKRLKRRPVIMDDSDEDDENDVKDKKTDTTNAAATATASRPEPKEEKGTLNKEIEHEQLQVSSTSLSKQASVTMSSTVKKEEVVEEAKDAPSTATSTPAESNAPELVEAQDSPERRKLVARAKKIAKAYKVEPIVEEQTSSPVQYQELVKVFDKIEAVSGRLEIQAMLTKFLRQVLQCSPKDLNACIYLASNSVAPAYECVELGIGDSLLIKAIAEAYGSQVATVKAKYEKEGDLGSVAQTAKSKQRTLGFGLKPKPLTIHQVLSVFREIANISGSSSQKLKVDKIKRLLVAVQDSGETKYIIRGLQGKLRIGLAQSTVLISLAHALTMTIPSTVVVKPANIKMLVDNNEEVEKEEREDPTVKALMDESLPVEKTLEAAANMIRKVYSEVPSYDALLNAALKVPLVELHKACHFQPGIPVEPMLAKPTKSIQEVLKRLNGQEFTCEFKYDGERAQIHKTSDGKLKVFSRNLLETSNKYPEVPQFVQEAATAAATKGELESPVDSFVLDAEVVAYNRETGQLVPFQILSTRKKTEESAETAKVQVIVQAFDLMFLNGRSLLSKTLKERRELLHKHFIPVDGRFQFAKALDHVEDGDTTVLEQFLDIAVKGQCEGLMVKTMDDVYEPSRRSLNWLKLKKDYLDGLGDSFDLVVIGGYHGRGKRTGVYGAYLLACYDEDSEEFQSVCKIGTGFSDEDLQTLSKTLNEHKMETKSSQYVTSDQLECDVWFDAVQVWEIKAADLSKSSAHRGAVGKLEEGRGIGLRFPRFERVRDDKSPEQATNSDQILDLYYNQDTVKGQKNGDDYDSDDGI